LIEILEIKFLIYLLNRPIILNHKYYLLNLLIFLVKKSDGRHIISPLKEFRPRNSMPNQEKVSPNHAFEKVQVLSL